MAELRIFLLILGFLHFLSLISSVLSYPPPTHPTRKILLRGWKTKKKSNLSLLRQPPIQFPQNCFVFVSIGHRAETGPIFLSFQPVRLVDSELKPLSLKFNSHHYKPGEKFCKVIEKIDCANYFFDSCARV